MNDFKEDIIDGAVWTVKAFRVLGMNLDYTVQSIQHIERVLDDQFTDGRPEPNGLFSSDLKVKLFSLAAYIGETILENTKASTWLLDHTHFKDDPEMQIKLDSGTSIWPHRKLTKRIEYEEEGNLYDYVMTVIKESKESIKIEKNKCPWWKFWNL